MHEKPLAAATYRTFEYIALVDGWRWEMGVTAKFAAFVLSHEDGANR